MQLDAFIAKYNVNKPKREENPMPKMVNNFWKKDGSIWKKPSAGEDFPALGGASGGNFPLFGGDRGRNHAQPQASGRDTDIPLGRTIGRGRGSIGGFRPSEQMFHSDASTGSSWEIGSPPAVTPLRSRSPSGIY